MKRGFWKKDELKGEASLERKVYYHRKNPTLDNIDDVLYAVGDAGREVEQEHLIPYDGRTLLLFENLSSALHSSDKYIIVPGFIIGAPKKYDPTSMRFGKRETMVSLVEPIKDDDLKDKVRILLKEKGLTKGYDISFW